MAHLCCLDDYTLDEFLPIAVGFGQQDFGYVVTPNVDHLIRYHDDQDFRSAYREADFVLLDSRVLAGIFRLAKGIRTKICTGSDLTARLFHSVIQPCDRIVVIGSEESRVRRLSERFGLRNLRHLNPPMGFARDERSVDACLRFVEESSPFRFCFFAVGAPRQEMLAQRLKARGIARGLGLCVGASINFLTGDEPRAPRWIRSIGAEWVYRLCRDPVRLAPRYLIRGPRVFTLIGRTRLVLRPAFQVRGEAPIGDRGSAKSGLARPTESA